MKNKIRTLTYIFYSFCLALLFVQCEKEPAPGDDETKTGYLTISPSISIDFLKSAQIVDTDSFKIEIYSLSDVLIHEVDNFIDLSLPLELPVGDYYLIIHSNNLVPAAFEEPYYEGRSANFEIANEATTNVDVTAELANVKVTVQYSAQTQADFIGFKTVVSTGTDSLEYLNQDVRAGYFIVTPLTVRAELVFNAVGGGTDTLVILGEILNPQPKDHVSITVQGSISGGGISIINLTVDESTNPVNITIGEGLALEPLIDSRDAQEYEIVQIGDQVWMAENLNFLPGSASISSFGAGSENTTFYYQNDPAKGILYNWPAAMDNTTSVGSQGVCPSGWHIPTAADWNELTTFVDNDGNTPFGAQALKSASEFGGTDDYGFAALPGGLRIVGGGFGDGSSDGYWWTSNSSGFSAEFRNMDFGNNVNSSSINKSSGMSVRCIQD